MEKLSTDTEEYQDMITDTYGHKKERNHGHWMAGLNWKNEHYCSECRYRAIAEKLDWQYCPRCGADMRGDNE